VIPVGVNPTRFWGMDVDERLRRIVATMDLVVGDGAAGDAAVLLVNRRFVFDPAWLSHYAARPGETLTLGGVPVLAHCRTAAERDAARRAMEADAPLAPDATLVAAAFEAGGVQLNAQLRKREQPFAIRLEPATVRAAERASYFGAYKGVTDLLTKYLWPEWALVLTRIAARLGITPNMVTALGAALCVLAAIFFWRGQYWPGMAAGLGFMVLDTVDGKLARCTITSSRIGNILDHGLDQVHPPFWWYAWGVGLAAWGQKLAEADFLLLMAVLIGGYLVQRLIEGVFMRRYGMHIHVWTELDSRFRLITARRNPNMVILFVFLLFGEPDVGLYVVAWWTLISCLFHGVRLAQAMRLDGAGSEVRSWLG
jgi:phosphatidylglycerophosphate synthase